MPLSEHEQRLLEQIEQALYAEDPKFASIYRSNDLRSHARRRLVRAGGVLVVGLGLLLAGVVTKVIAIGVVGFVIMLAAVSYAVASWQRLSGRRTPTAAPAAAPVSVSQRPRGVRRPAPGSSGGAARPVRPRRSIVERLEDRWQRRQDER